MAAEPNGRCGLCEIHDQRESQHAGTSLAINLGDPRRVFIEVNRVETGTGREFRARTPGTGDIEHGLRTQISQECFQQARLDLC